MPLYPELKVVGWTSGYRSIQKYLNGMKKEKESEEMVDLSLNAIAMLCKMAGQNPDEIIASLKSRRVDSDYYYKLGKDKLRQLGGDEGSFKFLEACFTLFMLDNDV